MQLSQLRKEVKFNSELLSLVETLKNVAGSQYHQMEKDKERFDRFMEAFSGFFRVVDLVDVEHPLARVSTDRVGIIMMTSDSGFMGGLNQNVVRGGLAALDDIPEDKRSIVLIGEKGVPLLAGHEYKFFSGIGIETIYEQAVEIRDYIVNEVVEGRMGRVMVAYPRPLSFTAQTIDVINILPCGELFDKDAETEVSQHSKIQGIIADARKVIIESSFADMVEYLASVWVSSKLYEVFEDSKLAEFSARAMHLEGSLQKVEKDMKKVKQQWFKASHEKVDKGMRESFAAKATGKDRKKKASNAA